MDLRFLGTEVIKRLDKHGDLFAPLLDAKPRKPRKKPAKKP
jgi:hypothetical protein